MTKECFSQVQECPPGMPLQSLVANDNTVFNTIEAMCEYAGQYYKSLFQAGQVIPESLKARE